ncbi:Gag-Pro-Pol polyprotein, partial [Lemmus lemmus]
EIKQAVITYGLHSPYVHEILKTWSSCNKITPFDWHRMTTAVLETGTALSWSCLFKKEAQILVQQEKEKGIEVSVDQIIGAGRYSDPLDQAGYDDHILSLCTTAAMTAWSRLQEPGQQEKKNYGYHQN